MRTQFQPDITSQQGVSIIEAMIAILIFSIGVLGIVGMQASMMKNTSESKFRADASFIAQEQIGLLWTSPDTKPSDASSTDTLIPDLLPAGTLTIARSGVEYTVTVTWQQPGEEKHSHTTVASINGG